PAPSLPKPFQSRAAPPTPASPQSPLATSDRPRPNHTGTHQLREPQDNGPATTPEFPAPTQAAGPAIPSAAAAPATGKAPPTRSVAPRARTPAAVYPPTPPARSAAARNSVHRCAPPATERSQASAEPATAASCLHLCAIRPR